MEGGGRGGEKKNKAKPKKKKAHRHQLFTLMKVSIQLWKA